MLSPIILALLFALLGALRFFISLKNARRSPPGPWGLPIIGHLHMLGDLPHERLWALAKKYGPIMKLRLGSVPTIVVTSPRIAELFLKTHDLIFSNRPKNQATEYVSYGTKGMGFAQYGAHWRNVRKLCTLEVFTVTRINSFSPLRRKEIELLVESIKESAVARKVVNVSSKVDDLIEVITYKMVFGRSKFENADLKGCMTDVMLMVGTFNLADYVPWLGIFDLQRMKPRMKAVGKAIDDILEQILDEHEKANAESNNNHHKDFVDSVLSLMNKSWDQNDENAPVIDRTTVKAIILDVVSGTIDTSASSILWTMSELLRNPGVMKKLQDELDSIIGKDKFVEETDLAKLEYLDMVVKESLRLHPVAPLLLPHTAREDVVVDGYFIPKNSRVIVNAHAIGRDPEAWSENAEEFYPDRFINNNVDVKGQNFQLIPFSSGRRMCPGMHLGLTTVKIVLSRLVHCFDWELPDNMEPKDLDMTVKFGLTAYRASPLLAKPIYRLEI